MCLSLLIINRSPHRSINFNFSNNCFAKAQNFWIKNKKMKNLTSLNDTCVERISIGMMKHKKMFTKESKQE